MAPQPLPPLLTLDNFNIDTEVTNYSNIFILVSDDNTKSNEDDNHQVPENCPFVLTSPRSLEACRRAGVQVRI